MPDNMRTSSAWTFQTKRHTRYGPGVASFALWLSGNSNLHSIANMSFNKAILRAYAAHTPTDLPPHVYFEHSEHTVTVFDKFPKAHFHFLVLPRVQSEGPLNAANLTSLKTLLNSPEVGKKEALALLKRMKKDAEHVRDLVVEEMHNYFGFEWGVNIGFHAVQSMDHLHLHVISDDLTTPGMKTKKHYNSFHPRLGFFLRLDEVLLWFQDGRPGYYFQSMINLDVTSYENKLKEPLVCLHCFKEQKNMPLLRLHLKGHFDNLIKETRVVSDLKRKYEELQTGELRRDDEQEQEQEQDNEHDSGAEKADGPEHEHLPDHQSVEIPRKKQKLYRFREMQTTSALDPDA
ncbi:hypothetical protein EW145_g5507 [Phellinidium pouzarii]|uniref:HIT domain-containing protein n=1 Tax=Phellinidium pouzarii TaxID=167371 RepID=A0A4S4L4I3_9AGAM|nr:hypothetical protein EW145_g5507 [Phellinidium pouzarii]